MPDNFEPMMEAMEGVQTIKELADLVVLGRVMKRILTADEPGFDAPGYVGFREGSMTIDCAVLVTEVELKTIKELIAP